MLITTELREGAITLARDAAAAILGIYDSAFAVEHKADASPLTAADLAAHRILVEGLERLTPEIPVLSEEAAEDVAWSVRSDWRRLWLVDPLDGTREFVKRNGEFTVNLALVEEGVVVFGIVQAPVTGAVWHATRGSGAFRRDGQVETPLQVRQPALAPLRVAASRSHRDPRTEAFMARLAGSVRGAVEPIGLGLR